MATTMMQRSTTRELPTGLASRIAPEGTSPAIAARLAQLATITTLRRGETLVHSAGTDMAVILLEGRVHLASTTRRDAWPLTLEIICDDEAWSRRFVAGEHHGMLVADSDVMLALLPRHVVDAGWQASPELAAAVIASSSQRLRTFREALDRLAFRGARERILHLLGDLDARFGHPTIDGRRILNLSLTHEELGRMIAVRRPTTTTTLGQLAEQGIISFRGRRIVIEMSAELLTAPALPTAVA